MATRKTRDIRSALTSKGFREDRGGHHVKLVLQVNGTDTPVFTFISHGRKEYGDSLLGVMANSQLRLSKADLLRLIDCPMSREEYLNHLSAAGELDAL